MASYPDEYDLTEAELEGMTPVASDNEISELSLSEADLEGMAPAPLAESDLEGMVPFEEETTLLEGAADIAKVGGAGITNALLGMGESIWRTPDMLKRGYGALHSMITGTELPDEYNPISYISEGFSIGDYKIEGTTGLAERIGSSVQTLPEMSQTFADVAEAGANADKAFNEALGGEFTRLGQVVKDPKAWSGFIGQAVPSLFAAWKSGGSMTFMGWLEGMEQAGSAAEFEKITGQKMDDETYTASVLATGMVNGALEKMGLESILKGKGSLVRQFFGGMTGEAATEGAQSFSGNLISRLYDKDASLTEGMLPGMMGGAGTGGPAGFMSGVVNKMTPPRDALDEISDTILGDIETEKEILGLPAPVIVVTPEGVAATEAGMQAAEELGLRGEGFVEPDLPGEPIAPAEGTIDFEAPDMAGIGETARGTRAGGQFQDWQGGIPFEEDLSVEDKESLADLRGYMDIVTEKGDVAGQQKIQSEIDVFLKDKFTELQLQDPDKYQPIRGKGRGVEYTPQDLAMDLSKEPAVFPEEALPAAELPSIPNEEYNAPAIQQVIKKLKREKRESDKGAPKTVLHDIASNSPIDWDMAVAEGIDPADIKAANRMGMPFGKPLFKKGTGNGFDSVAEKFSELGVPGFEVGETYQDTAYGADNALTVVSDMISGKRDPVYIPGSETAELERQQKGEALDNTLFVYENLLEEVGQYESILENEGQEAADEFYYQQRAMEGYEQEVGGEFWIEGDEATADTNFDQAGEKIADLLGQAVAVDPEFAAQEFERLVDASDAQIARAMYNIIRGEKDEQAIETAKDQEEQRQEQGDIAAEPVEEEQGRRREEQVVETEQRKADRRTEPAKRKRVSEMSEAEKDVALLTNKKSGLRNERAYEEDEQLAYQSFFDIDNFKQINDEYTYDGADKILKAFGDIMLGAANENVIPYHLHGDEFIVQSNSPIALKAFSEKVQKALNDVDVTIEFPDGEVKTATNIGASYGIAKTKEQAESNLKKDKAARAEAGLRTERERDTGGLPEQAAREGEDTEGRIEAEQDLDAALDELGDLLPGAKSAAEISEAAADAEGHTASQAQIDAGPNGNYKKGHLYDMQGLNLAIENEAGTKRNKMTPESWPVLAHSYGDVKPGKDYDAIGADGDQLDFFIKKDVDIPADNPIYVINQNNKDGSFDETKTMIGFDSAEDAKKGYTDSYSDDFTGFGDITEATPEQYKDWLVSGDTTKTYPLTTELELTGQTEAEIQADEQASVEAKKKEAELEKKAEVDEGVDEFALTGSEREADIAAAAGQEDLLAEPAEKPDDTEATAVLDAANVRGKDRLDAMSKFRSGEYSLDDLTAAYPTEIKPIAGMSEKEIKAEIEEIGDRVEEARKVAEPEGKAIPPELLLTDLELMSEADKVRMHDLKQALQSAGEEAEAAKERIKKRRAEKKKLSVTQYGNTFETGKPVTFNYLHNKESATEMFGAPDKDSPYGRGYEPSGRFMTVVANQKIPDYGDFETGELTFNNPLVVYNDDLQWKKTLSDKYNGATGSKLSQAVIEDGYDGIVTIDKTLSDQEYVSEVVDLVTFDQDKAMYSIEKAAEEIGLEDDLYISHNLSVENLLHADKVGGLAVPSLAIARAGTGFESFGEISLIADKSLLQDPYAKTFGADIYSPRYPSVSYQIDNDKYNEIVEPINKELKEDGLDFIRADIESRGIAEIYYDDGARYTYFKSKDKEPKLTYRKKASVPIYLRKFTGDQYSISRNKDFAVTAKKYFTKKAESNAKAMEDADKGSYDFWLKDWNNTFFDDEGSVKYRHLETLAYDVSKYNQPKQADTYELGRKLAKKLKTTKSQEEFKEWIEETFSDAIAGERIFKGYTPSGNRKYIAHTLDNAVKEMKSKLRGGENFNYGVGTIRSATAPQFKNIKQIQKSREKIVSKEVMDGLKEESSNEFDKIAEEIKPYYKYESNGFGYYDAAAENLFGMARGRGLVDFENVPDGVRTEAAEFLAKLRDMPTEYFESKIQRAVELDEFVAAVVPKGTSKKVKDILKGHGLKVKTYDPKIKAARAKVIGGIKGILFSASSFTPNKPETIKGITEAQAEEALKIFLKEIGKPSGVKIFIAPTKKSAMTDEVYSKFKKDQVRGFYKSGTEEIGGGRIVLILEDIESVEKAVNVLRHEWVAHHGLNTFNPSDKKKIINRIRSSKGEMSLKAAWAHVENNYPNASPDIQAEELLAYMAENKATRLSKLWNDLVLMIQNALKKMGLIGKGKITKAEVIRFVEDLASRVGAGAAQQTYEGEVAYSKKRVQGSPEQEAAMADTIAEKDHEKTWSARIKGFFDRIRAIDGAELRQGFIDEFNAIAEYEKGEYGEVTDASRSASKAAKRTKNLDSVMAAILMAGPIEYRDGAFQLKKGGKGFNEIFDELSKKGLIPLWEAWAGANRANRLIRENKEQNFTQEQIDVLLMLEHEHLGENGENLFRNALEEYQDFNKQILDMAESVGVIDPEARALWESNDYVPFYRAMEEIAEGGAEVMGPRGKGGIQGQRSGIKKLIGGEEKVNSIIENMVLNTAHLVDASFKNVAMQRVVELTEDVAMEPVDPAFQPVGIDAGQMVRALRKIGVLPDRDTAIEMEMETGVPVGFMTSEEQKTYLNLFRRVAPAGNDIVSVMVDGNAKYYRVNDRLLLRSITNMGVKNLDEMMKVMRGAKRLLTKMVTIDPGFMIANFMRDTLSTVVVSHAGLKPGIDAVKGFMDAMNEDPALMAIMAAGGGGGGFYHATPAETQANLHHHLNEMRDKDFKETVLDSPKKLWNAWQKVGAASENANRIAIFKKIKEAGGTTAEAVHQAQDILNFTQTGDFATMKFLIETVPFMNARVQGLDRLYRGAKEDPKAFMVKGMMLAAASMAMLAANWDDDEYDELQEWDKDTYWHFFLGEKNKNGVSPIHLRLPKPFEVGAIFATIPERIARAVAGKDDSKTTAEAAGRMVGDTFAMNPIPQLFKPMAEQYMDKLFFTGSPIVGRALENVAPEAQYTAWTSEAMRALAESLPDDSPEWLRSPKRLEAALRGYTGTMGSYVLAAADVVVREAGDYPDAPTISVSRYPVLGRFMRGSPTSTKFTNEFYDAVDKANEAYSTIKKYREEGEIGKASALRGESMDLLGARKKLNRYARKIGEINNKIKRLQSNRMMTAEKKRDEVDRLTQIKLDLQKKGALLK